MGQIKGITIEIDGKTTGLTKALKSANAEIKSTQSNLKAMEKALKLDPKNVDLLKAKQNALNEVIKETKEKLDMEKQAAESAKKELELGNITQGEYDALQAEIVTTTKNLEDLEKQARQSASVLGSQMQAAGAQIQEVGTKVQDVGSSINSFGSSMTKNVTAPIVAAGTASIAAFNEVDAGMDIIVKKTGATGKTLEGFEDVAKKIAQDIPTSFETAGAAVGEVNTRFGVTGSTLEDLSTRFIKFAELNDTDVSGSIDNVQKVMAAYNVDISHTGGLLDTLNATGQATGISVDTLASLMVTNSAAMQQMGLNAASSANFLGKVEMSGADTSQVMSGLSKALKNATADGKPLDEALAEIQSSMVDAKTETEGLQAAYDLFGTKAGAAVYQACKSGSLSFQELSASMTDNIGNVNTTYDAMLDDTDKLKTTMNTVKVAASEVGATLASMLAPILENISEKIRGLGEKWNSLSDSQQQHIIAIAGVVAVIGPLIALIGTLINSVGKVIFYGGQIVSLVGSITTWMGTASTFITGTMIPAITGVVTAIGPFLLIAAAVIAVITAIIVVIKNWDAIVEVAQFVWESFCEKVSQLVTAFKEFFTSAFQAIGSFFTGIWTGIVSVATNAWSSIRNVFSTVGSFFTGIFQQAWNGITSIFNRLGSFFSGVWNSVTGIFKSAGMAIGNAISGAVKTAVNFVLSKAIGIINGFIGAINAVIGVINKIPGVSLSKISKLGVPQLERGGVLAKGQVGLLEGNGAEAVVPLDQNEKWIAAVAREMKAALAGNRTAMAAGDIVIPVYIGQSKLNDIIVRANQINNYRSGGR